MTHLLRLDAVQLIRDRLAVGILAAGILACLVAVITGMAWQDRLTQDREAVRAEIETSQAKQRERWADTQGKDSVEVIDLALRGGGTTVQLAPPLLPDFTIGRSAIEPSAAEIGIGTRENALFARYQVENPERLARGGLDLGFVALVIAPLLLIGLGYGVFASDRENGTARLWLAQAGTPLRLIAVRSANRLALVFFPILLAALILWIAGPAGRGGAILEWLGVVALVLCFWWAVVLLVNSFRVGAETAALVLVGLWTLLVFAAPVAISAAAALVNPPPSRFEAIAAARVAELASTQSYEDDHPELVFATLEGRRDWLRKGNEVRQSVAKAVAPLEAETEQQFAAQRSFGGRLSLLSPSILANDTLAGIARTSGATYAGQRDAVKSFLRERSAMLTSAAFGERPINIETFDALPKFTPPPSPSRPWLPVVWIALVTLAITTIALARLRRIKPI